MIAAAIKKALKNSKFTFFLHNEILSVASIYGTAVADSD
jgi:hypothetical protein